MVDTVLVVGLQCSDQASLRRQLAVILQVVDDELFGGVRLPVALNAILEGHGAAVQHLIDLTEHLVREIGRLPNQIASGAEGLLHRQLLPAAFIQQGRADDVVAVSWVDAKVSLAVII